MPKRGEIDVEIHRILWTIGWRAKRILVAAVVLSLFALISDLEWEIAGLILAVGAVASILGVVYVWRRLKVVYDTGVERMNEAVDSLVDVSNGEVERYSIANNSSYGMLLPPREFYVTTLLTDDDVLIVHDGTTLDLRGLQWRMEEEVTEYSFDRIVDIEYEPSQELTAPGLFSISLSDGSTDAYRFVREPDGGLESLEGRILASRS